MHIDPRFGESALDVVLPMRRLVELSREGVVGRPAPTHYSMMGYTPPPIAELLKKKPWLLASLYSGRIPHVEGTLHPIGS